MGGAYPAGAAVDLVDRSSSRSDPSGAGATVTRPRRPTIDRVDHPHAIETERLTLLPASAADADALFPIFSDPEGWWYDPGGRHADPDRTRRFLARAAERWAEGLSYWTVRERGGQAVARPAGRSAAPPDAGAPTPSHTAGRVIGLGGAQRHASGAWNLSYRIATGVQGRGYATELAKAGQAAAADVDPTVPVIAWVATHNLPSRRVAERLGLVDRGLHVDANDGVTRLAYADRPIDAWVTF